MDHVINIFFICNLAVLSYYDIIWKAVPIIPTLTLVFLSIMKNVYLESLIFILLSSLVLLRSRYINKVDILVLITTIIGIKSAKIALFLFILTLCSSINYILSLYFCHSKTFPFIPGIFCAYLSYLYLEIID
jgi:hypothetical protein